MGQGSGSANKVMGLVMGLLLLMSMAQPSLAAVYYVGGTTGWTYNVVGWTNGMKFKAGDYLVFKYNKSQHNVVAVGRSDYNRCTVPKQAKTRQTGKDMIRLKRGVNYFICSVNMPGHCKAGMKIAAKAI